MSRDTGPQWNAVPPAGQPPLGEASTKRKKWPFWLAGAVGVIIVLAIIGSLTGGSKVAPSAGTTTTSTPTSTVTTTPSTTPTTASSTAERPSTAKPTFSTQTSVVQRTTAAPTPTPTATTQPIPAPPTTATREAEPVPPPAVDPPSGGLNFRSCAEAKKAGFSNMRRGTPGYSANLDRDGDGIACDKVG